jgi:hypothetical protein
MTLGIISFGVKFMESTGLLLTVFSAFQEPNSHEDIHDSEVRIAFIFEFVHILLFFLTIFYIITSSLAYLSTRRTWKNWERQEKNTEKDTLDKYNKINQKYKKSNILAKIFNVVLIYKYLKQIDLLDYHIVRSIFIQTNKLNKNFRFDLYLKTQIQHVYIEMIEISWYVWMCLFGISFSTFFLSTLINSEILFNLGGVEILTTVSILSFLTNIFVFLFFRASFFAYKKKNQKKYLRFIIVLILIERCSNLIIKKEKN